ncbi:hypothetical protein M0802_002334 [Mischocyttarus mexicanus]|nr:hypothetical protein M0802_002334 [Mischocyttarus mexicanus]
MVMIQSVCVVPTTRHVLGHIEKEIFSNLFVAYNCNEPRRMHAFSYVCDDDDDDDNDDDYDDDDDDDENKEEYLHH